MIYYSQTMYNGGAGAFKAPHHRLWSTVSTNDLVEFLEKHGYAASEVSRQLQHDSFKNVTFFKLQHASLGGLKERVKGEVLVTLCYKYWSRDKYKELVR